MEISRLLRKQARARKTGLNLIASENTLLPDAAAALGADLSGRYHAPFYGGSSHVRDIIGETERLARKLFGAKFAAVTPLSGNLCDLAVLFAFTNAGDAVAAPHFRDGGYPLGYALFQRRHLPLPAKKGTFKPDAAAGARLVRKERPPLVMLGSSYIPFAHPVVEVSRAADERTRIVYDGAHVMGLIACGEFQRPLQEGAQILIGSTHKTLYGPQGGMLLTNNKELFEKAAPFLDLDLEKGIGLIDNPHPGRIAALGLTLENLLVDRGYGKRVITNARALGAALVGEGVPMRFGGKTDSHQLFIGIPERERERFMRRCEKAGIFVDTAARLGTAEATRRGMARSEMEGAAALLARVYHGENLANIRRDVSRFTKPWMI